MQAITAAVVKYLPDSLIPDWVVEANDTFIEMIDTVTDQI